MTCMRVVLSVVDDGDYKGDPVVIDLRVNDKGQVLKNGNMYGSWGNPGSADFYPFMMDVDGNIDYGGEEWSEERNEKTNLLDKTIKVNEYCTHQISKSQSVTLQIKDVHSLE